MIELNVAIKNKQYQNKTCLTNQGENSNHVVLSQIEFKVKRGEFLAIIGPSGCGKTTLLNMISGIESCRDQHISFDNSPTTNPPPLGYIFQQPRLMPWLSVRENIELVLKPDQYPQIDDLLAQVGLASKCDFFPRQLSGGMQRRVSIARAFAINPQLLLLDEPFNSLDAPTANHLRQLLINMCKQRGTTVVFVTHDLQEAIYLADRILFMSHTPSTIVHHSKVELPEPRTYSGVSELAWQLDLMKKYPALLSGKIS